LEVLDQQVFQDQSVVLELQDKQGHQESLGHQVQLDRKVV